MEEIFKPEMYSDFTSALRDQAKLEAIRRMILNGEKCSNAIRSVLDIPISNPFGEGGSDA